MLAIETENNFRTRVHILTWVLAFTFEIGSEHEGL